MTDLELDEFIDNSYSEMELKQSKLMNEYKIGEYERYWFDQDTKKLQLIDGEEIQLEFDIICIGTFAHLNGTWMWSWANVGMADCIQEDSEVFKELKGVTGLKQFEMEGFTSDDVMAYELTAMCVHHINAQGMYRIPGEKSHLFVALIRNSAEIKLQ